VLPILESWPCTDFGPVLHLWVLGPRAAAIPFAAHSAAVGPNAAAGSDAARAQRAVLRQPQRQ
jgi:hypothetical protein